MYPHGSAPRHGRGDTPATYRARGLVVWTVPSYQPGTAQASRRCADMPPHHQQVRHGHKIHYFREMPPERRPQDPTREGAGWTFQLVEHGGECPDNMPQAMIATDARGRSYTLVPNLGDMAPDRRPQDPAGDGAGWTFQTPEHGGEYPDDMPQAIRLSDAQGRSRIYVPVKGNGRAVETISFEMVNHET
jgi:hypothetical protein